MKHMRNFALLFAGCALGLLLSIPSLASAQTAKQGKAEVRAVRGVAKYSTGSGVWMPLTVGLVLRSGAIVQTEAESSVDLFLGANGPMVRVTEATLLALDKLALTETGADTVIETQLNLRAGRILGRVDKMAKASRYEVKTPNGVAGIRGTRYDISANGMITVVEGRVIFAYVNPADGTVRAFVINKGETFVPPGNVAPADPALLDGWDLPEDIKEIITPETPILIFVAPTEEGRMSPDQPGSNGSNEEF